MSEYLPVWVWMVVLQEHDGSGELTIRVYKTEARMKADLTLLAATHCPLKVISAAAEVIA